MSGTKEGGRKAAATNKRKYGDEFYARIGKRGGHNGTTGGFASDIVGDDGLTGRERAKTAGAQGGRKSRRNNECRQKLERNRDFIVSQLGSGVPATKIAGALNVSVDSLRRWSRKNGLYE